MTRIGGREIYDGRVVHLDVDRVRFPDGTEAELEIVRHPGGAAVVPVRQPSGAEDGPAASGSDAGEPSVILLRQYRHAAGGDIWEIPAGKLSDGEDPEACALRELEEEAGVRAGRIRSLTSIFTTPGFADERLHLFLATDLEDVRTSHEDSEFIERHEVPVSRAVEMVGAGAIEDSKSVAALLYALRFTDALGGRAPPEPLRSCP